MKQTISTRYRDALWGIACAIFVLSLSVKSETLVDQTFNYPDGPLVSSEGSLWEHRSGTEGDLMVQNGQLNIASSASEDVGIPLSDQSYDAESDVTLYASFTLTVTEKPSSGGGYFAHFRGGSSATFRGRLFIAASEEGDGFKLGISNGGSSFSDSTMLDQNLELNQSYRIVMSYQPSTAATRLGVDPVSEDDLNWVAGDEASVRGIDQFAFRQVSGIGHIKIDTLKVTTEFSDLTALVIPEKPVLRINNNMEILPERGGFSLLVVIQRDGVTDVSLDVGILWAGTAVFGEDYTGQVGQIHFEPNQVQAEITLEILDDDVKEGSEILSMSFVESESYDISGSSSVEWHIADDDLTTIHLSSQVLTVTEGDEQDWVVVLEREGDVQTPLTIPLEVGGVAERGTDFELSFPLSPAFEPGQTRLELFVQILNDDLTESEENLILFVLGDPSYQIASGRVEITIQSDDFSGIVLEETFDYPDGPLTEVSYGRWQHASGEESEILAFAGQLDVNEVQAEDVYISIPIPEKQVPNLPGMLYMGMDVFFAKAPEGDGTYWAHLRGGNSSSYRARLFVRSVAGSEGNFELGISNGSSGADVWYPEVFTAPMRLRIVLAYQLQEAQTSLWVNPMAELDLSVVALDEASSSQLTALAIRQPSSVSGGIGRMLLDHLVVSTVFDDVLRGSDKPVVFWDFRPDSFELPPSIAGLDDPVKTIRSILPESMPRSRDLHLRRMAGDGRETWVDFGATGSIELGRDLNILQGMGPILVPAGKAEGLIQLAAISDLDAEDPESLHLALKPGDSYQLGYPSEAVIVLDDVPPPPSTDIEPVRLSIVSEPPGGGSNVRLLMNGALAQAFTIEMSKDLIHWETWQSGDLGDADSRGIVIDTRTTAGGSFFRIVSPGNDE
jgi:hypothetical protein